MVNQDMIKPFINMFVKLFSWLYSGIWIERKTSLMRDQPLEITLKMSFCGNNSLLSWEVTCHERSHSIDRNVVNQNKLIKYADIYIFRHLIKKGHFLKILIRKMWQTVACRAFSGCNEMLGYNNILQSAFVEYK